MAKKSSRIFEIILLFIIFILVIIILYYANLLSRFSQKIIINNIQKQEQEPSRIHEDRYNPFQYPAKHYFSSASRINIPTRGYIPQAQQLGVMTNKTHDKIIPLYGNPVYPGSNQWKYYTSTDNYNPLKIKVEKDKKDCTEMYGCKELTDGDNVKVPIYGENDDFQISLYSNDSPMYIPFFRENPLRGFSQ